MDRSTRFLFYSHDSFGLGHLRRTLALARAVSELDPGVTELIVTGSTVATSYRLPPRADTVKLPVLTKDASGTYSPLRLAVSLESTLQLRSELARAAARAFDPAVAVIDKTPLGLRGELLPALVELKARGRCKLVLGLRDIEDSRATVRREWGRVKMLDAIHEYYDAVLVYGPPETMDALDCMEWSLGVPVHHVGYVSSPMPEAGPPDLPPDYLLVTVGGGGDGVGVFAAIAGAMRLRPLPCHTVIVTGPLMADRAVERLLRMTAGLDVTVQEFRADMEAVIAGARAVVAMAGYNTVSELLRARKPALLVPRVRPRQEQLLRAQAVAASGWAGMLHPDDLSPAVMRDALDLLLTRTPPPGGVVDGDGATRAAAILGELAGLRPAVGERARRVPVPATSPG